MKKKKKEKEKEALHHLFKIADADNSGVIDPSEVSGILKQLGWNVNVHLAIKLTEKIGVVSNEKGTFLLNEEEFVHAMASGKILRQLNKLNIKRRGKSMMNKGGRSSSFIKNSDAVVQKEEKQKKEKKTKEKTKEKTILVEKSTDENDENNVQVSSSDMGQSLGSRNKLVMWTLRHLAVSRTLSGATQLLLLAHTPVSRKVFQYFHFNDIEGKKFLRADYNMIAWSNEYQHFLPIVISVMFGFTVALPATISFYLCRHKNELYSTSVYQTIGWLYDAFVRGAEFWQVHGK